MVKVMRTILKKQIPISKFKTASGLCDCSRFISFQLEGYNEYTACVHDSVSVYDGERINANDRIGRYCGPLVPAPVTSNTDKLLVHFVTDGSITRQGFSAEYSQIATAPSTPSELDAHIVICKLDSGLFLDWTLIHILKCFYENLALNLSRKLLPFTRFWHTFCVCIVK